MKILKFPEYIFLIFAILFGTIMLLITPKNLVPDEHAHILRAQEVAHGVLYNSLPGNRHDGYSFHGASGYSPILYTFSALGYKFGSLSGNPDAAFLCGRFFNLAVWIFLIFFAIRITPVFKWQFLFVSMLPMSVYLGMSYSADSFTIAFAFIFFAYLFRLIFEKKYVEKKDIVLLVLLSCIAAFTKGVIYPIVLFYFLPMKKYKNIFATSMLLLAFILMIFWSSINYAAINPAVDVALNKYKLIHEPLDFIVKYSNSFQLIWFYIRGCVGILGLLNVELGKCFYYTTPLIFCSLFFVFNEPKIKNIHRIISIFTLIFFWTITHLMFYLVWTLSDAGRVAGVQGRYLIPVLPFVFLLFAQNKEYFSEKFVSYYKIFLIIYIFVIQIHANIILFKTFT